LIIAKNRYRLSRAVCDSDVCDSDWRIAPFTVRWLQFLFTKTFHRPSISKTIVISDTS
jgi:hypothetical protein